MLSLVKFIKYKKKYTLRKYLTTKEELNQSKAQSDKFESASHTFAVVK